MCARRLGNEAAVRGEDIVVAQLRMYVAKPGELDAFMEEWRRGVVPLRRSFGFEVLGAWTVREEDRFVWIITLPGDRRAFEARDAAYYASPQRKALQPDPARHLVKVEHWIMEPVPAGAGSPAHV